MGFLKNLLAPKKQEEGPIKREGQYFLNEEEYQKWKFDCECTDLCEKGLKAQGNGDIEEAIQIYELLLSRNFEGTAPYRGLCEIYHKQEKYQDEIRVIKQLRKVTSKERYKSGNKYRWYDKRYDELTSK